MSFRIYGIATSEDYDQNNEKILLDGVDETNFKILKDEHVDDIFGKIGAIMKCKKIYSIKDAEDFRQKKCWNMIKKPFLYYEADLFDGHPNAQAAKSMIEFVYKNKLPIGMKCSIEGPGARLKNDNSIYGIMQPNSVVLTVRPVNQDCWVFPYNDVKKSNTEINIDNDSKFRLFDSIYKSDLPLKEKEEQLGKINIEPKWIMDKINTKIKDLKESLIKDRILEIKKSISNDCSVNCFRCGSTSKFVINGEWPNSCMFCGNKFRMLDFYNNVIKEQ